MRSNFPTKKHTIIGGGIIGLMEAYAFYLEAKKSNEQTRITIYEKNHTLDQTTTSNIFPSLTPDEILSVVPRGLELVKKLKVLFSDAGGIRVDDVKGVESAASERFNQSALEYSKDDAAHAAREKALLSMGELSMRLWQEMYDTADDELKKILEDSNFNPCREPRKEGPLALHDGYRIDLISDIPNANDKAESMKKDYEKLEFKHCKVLSPSEVLAMDPYLAHFCEQHSELNHAGKHVWKKDASALFRPGGCIDTNVFLPKFQAYLTNVMGKYTNNAGTEKDYFRLKFAKKVTGIIYNKEAKHTIDGLSFFDDHIKYNKRAYSSSDYVFCPGEAVGTLSHLGFNEPDYAGFAGASLRLDIPVPESKRAEYSTLNHCMEVHKEGVVLAWQARFKNDSVTIGVAGTKAYYGDQTPNITQDFAKNRNLLQLNAINQIYPQQISSVLMKETKDKELTADDLSFLESKNIAKRWVGVRAVAYDGVPTLGALYHNSEKVDNARTTTSLGSGGCSFAPAAVAISRSAKSTSGMSEMKYTPTMFQPTAPADEVLTQTVLRYGSSLRRA